ncbi:hypothetical protein ACOJVP_00360 [Mycobacterium sp. THU-M116]
MFAFGHGLSCSDFEYRGLSVVGGEGITADVDVVDLGDRAGADITQLYLSCI